MWDQGFLQMCNLAPSQAQAMVLNGPVGGGSSLLIASRAMAQATRMRGTNGTAVASCNAGATFNG